MQLGTETIPDEDISATASVDDSTTLLAEEQNNLLNIVKVNFIEKNS